MSARSKARKRALDVLYEADLRSVPAGDVLAAAHARADREVNPYTDTLVTGVAAHVADIDLVLATYAQDWTVERMPVVDRNLLRIATWEILYAPDVPDEVAISEAVALAETLAGDDSPAFVNGLLATISTTKPDLSVAGAPPGDPTTDS